MTRRCVYCGTQVDGGRPRRVCSKHADLPALDPDWTAWTMRQWWLVRFTGPELAVLTAQFDTGDFAQTHPRFAGIQNTHSPFQEHLPVAPTITRTAA